MKKKLFYGFFLLLSMSIFSQVWAQNVNQRDPQKYFFNSFLGDLTEELEVAKASGKQFILIVFEADDCPFCERMRQTVLNQVNVQQFYREHFRVLSIDINGDVEIVNFHDEALSMKDFSFKQLRVRATPVFAFFDLNGQVIKRGRYTGAMTGVDEFMKFGHFMANGIYKKMSFTRYKRSLKK